MKSAIYLVTLCCLFAGFSYGQLNNNRKKTKISPNLSAKKIVSPVYPDVFVITRISGTAIVSVKINNKGKVTDARFIQGVKWLGKISENAARNWTFNSTKSSEVRTAKLIFIYELISADSPYNEANVVFLPPYTLKIRAKEIEIEP